MLMSTQGPWRRARSVVNGVCTSLYIYKCQTTPRQRQKTREQEARRAAAVAVDTQRIAMELVSLRADRASKAAALSATREASRNQRLLLAQQRHAALMTANRKTSFECLPAWTSTVVVRDIRCRAAIQLPCHSSPSANLNKLAEITTTQPELLAVGGVRSGLVDRELELVRPLQLHAWQTPANLRAMRNAARSDATALQQHAYADCSSNFDCGTLYSRRALMSCHSAVAACALGERWTRHVSNCSDQEESEVLSNVETRDSQLLGET